MAFKKITNVITLTLIRAICAITITACFNFSQAMTFELIGEEAVEYKGHKFPSRLSILAEGEIKKGDASTFEEFLKKSGRDQFGNITLYLDSVGGSVQESLQMSKLMDWYEVTAIVPSGSICASACASILFISARIHIVHEGGYLALHPCKLNQEHVIELCNDEIAQHAVYHGTSHSVIRGFMSVDLYQYLPDQYKPKSNNDDLIYFGKAESILHGLYGPPLHDSTLAIASFNCTKKSSEADKLVCQSPQLSRYDASIRNIYLLLRDLFGLYENQWGDIEEIKNEAERLRKQCGSNYNCILENYSSLRVTLRNIYAKQLIYFAMANESNSSDSEFMDGFMMSLLEWCQDESECWYNYIPERPHQFFIENMVMQSITASDEDGIGPLGCQFNQLCDESLKNQLIEDIERDAIDAAQSELDKCSLNNKCNENDKQQLQNLLETLKE